MFSNLIWIYCFSIFAILPPNDDHYFQLSRNKLKERPKRGVRFNGQGFVSVDRSNFADLEDEFVVKMKFKPSGANGILFLVGNPEDGDYVCVELQNQYVVYR